MDLLALADFTLVARHGGFGRAARAANRPKATLSRRVAELEAVLGLRLFERGARDLKLTEEGRVLFERTGPLLTELEESAAAISLGGNAPKGRLRISAPLLFAPAQRPCRGLPRLPEAGVPQWNARRTRRLSRSMSQRRCSACRRQGQLDMSLAARVLHDS